MDSLVIATLLIAIFTLATVIASVCSILKSQEEAKINREIILIEKKLENFYNPLMFVLIERIDLIKKFEELYKTWKTDEKEDIKNKLLKNQDKIDNIYSKYLYIGLPYENEFTDSDISDFIGKNLIDKNEIDKYYKMLFNEYNELRKQHAVLRKKIEIRGVSDKELELHFLKEELQQQDSILKKIKVLVKFIIKSRI